MVVMIFICLSPLSLLVTPYPICHSQPSLISHPRLQSLVRIYHPYPYLSPPTLPHKPSSLVTLALTSTEANGVTARPQHPVSTLRNRRQNLILICHPIRIYHPLSHLSSLSLCTTPYPIYHPLSHVSPLIPFITPIPPSSRLSP